MKDAPVLTKTLKETPDMKGRFLQNGAFKKNFYTILCTAGKYRLWQNMGYRGKCN